MTDLDTAAGLWAAGSTLTGVDPFEHPSAPIRSVRTVEDQ